nr:pollen-specific leucine-rich repeat extensin-like protein 1 isoform X1 [Tanacetum cinerariifolium]
MGKSLITLVAFLLVSISIGSTNVRAVDNTPAPVPGSKYTPPPAAPVPAPKTPAAPKAPVPAPKTPAAPVPAPKAPAPAPKPKTPAPVPAPKTPAPAPKPKTPAPAPKTPAPAPKPKAPAPTPKPKTPTPAPKPKTPAPAPKPKTPAPAPKPKTPAPVPKPKTPAPAPKPKTPAPAPKPKTPAPAPKPKTPAPTPKPKTPAPGGDPNVTDMAHYVTIQDTNLQINGHFIGSRPNGRKRDYTWVQSLSVMFDTQTLIISANKVAQWDDLVDVLSVKWNGEEVTVPFDGDSEWRTSTEEREVVVERTDDTNTVKVTVSGLVEIDMKAVPVTKEDDKAHNYQLPSNDAFAHFELQFKFMNLSDDVEGILGKTYQPGYVSPVKRGIAMPIMGGEDKYETASLTSTVCKECKFQTPTTTPVIGISQY